MKLTGRQRQFVAKFIDLYQQANRPLHYVTVAQQLDVSPMTAYDMLRLLEEKGLVASRICPTRRRRPGTQQYCLLAYK